MGAFFETIPESLIPWILEQKVIWIASAPLSADGHVNVSPKGGSYFGVIDEKTFWVRYLLRKGCVRQHVYFIYNDRTNFSLFHLANNGTLANTRGSSIKTLQVKLIFNEISLFRRGLESRDTLRTIQLLRHSSSALQTAPSSQTPPRI